MLITGAGVLMSSGYLLMRRAKHLKALFQQVIDAPTYNSDYLQGLDILITKKWIALAGFIDPSQEMKQTHNQSKTVFVSDGFTYYPKNQEDDYNSFWVNKTKNENFKLLNQCN